MKSIQILGVKINNIDRAESFKTLALLYEKKSKSLICTPNTEFIIKAQRDNVFKDILNKNSSLNLPDGFGLLWAAKFLSLKNSKGKSLKYLKIIIAWIFTVITIPIIPNFYKNPIKDRISGVDFIWDVAQFAAKNNLKIFLLGGGPTIAERTALKLQSIIPNLKVAGVYSGDSSNTTEIVEKINKHHTEILLVGFGSPKQEKWLADNLRKTTAKIGVGLGGTFDFIAGKQKRAPFWMRKAGLEWLYRLILEPKRIKRQFALPKFLYLVLLEKIKTA